MLQLSGDHETVSCYCRANRQLTSMQSHGEWLAADYSSVAQYREYV